MPLSFHLMLSLLNPSSVGPQDVTQIWLTAVLSTVTIMARWQVLKTVAKHHISKEILLKCVWRDGSLTVKIVAFQAIDPGSTPGHRWLFPFRDCGLQACRPKAASTSAVMPSPSLKF